MTDEQTRLWRTKLAARLHDPVEKALILMRTSEGHEGGTSRALRERLGLTDLPDAVRSAVRQADHWASAADRAAFPNRNAESRYPSWQQVRFEQRPVIIHPLTGEELDLGTLTDVQPDAAKALARDHLEGLIHGDDLTKTALAFWRFGPELDASEIESLWAQLPADTRVPDHTIHDHLDLTAALATAFAADAGGPALLAVSLGPVQAFIAASRSTSDLWAGSHLLSRLAWEAMRVICERLGPEAILFPRLRGVPQVDLWLRDEMGLSAELFEPLEWTRSGNDANPLFAAALPNRFTAIVPAEQARELADSITTAVREWVREQGASAYRKLLAVAGIEDHPELPGYAQIAEQLSGFPEVHWTAVPWSLVETDAEDKVEASTPALRAAMQPYFQSEPPGHLGTRAWGLLSGGMALEEGWFWRPNPGALYPALHELLERVLAAAKGVRAFDQAQQAGWRDSLNGEAEWLTHDRDQLRLPPGQRTGTLWTAVAEAQPSWAKKGEHLSALNALKRLWPTLFMDELKGVSDLDVRRFVVSTHTMALATSLAPAIRDKRPLPADLAKELDRSKAGTAALPRKLATALLKHPERARIKQLPAWLDAETEKEDDMAARRAERLVEAYLGRKPEAYYGLLLMDGDRMGAWLAADSDVTLTNETSFHPQIRAGLQGMGEDLGFREYAQELRAPSPSRHMAISEALNNFSLTLAPTVAELHYHGRILYAGGDDLMAMFPVADLLPAMAALRAAYSGIDLTEVGLDDSKTGFDRQGNGFVHHKGRLLRVMGERATASAGAVIAHHQAPLGAVLRELRSAEQRAKQTKRFADGKDRNAFSLTIVKRSGGALYLTAEWGNALHHLMRLRDFLREPGVSRRAAYNSTVWLRDLPEPEGDEEMVARMLAYQFDRQAGSTAKHHNLPALAAGIVKQAIQHAVTGKRREWIENFLSVAEFLARETRAPGSSQPDTEKQEAQA